MRHGLLHHRDNTQARVSIVSMAAICQDGFELLHHLPHSVDLATSNLHVFQSLEDALCRQTFESDGNVIYAKNYQFEWLNEIFFVDVVKAFEHRWEKRVALDGVSAEKL